MSRPSFQFYTKDWRSNSKLRRCSPAARGVWVDILCALHDSDEYGIARYPLKELASEVGAPMAHVRELVDKGVLKGSDAQLAEPLVYIPRSGRKEGPAVTLLAAQAGPIWYSSRQVKDEYVRTVRGESSRFGEGDGDSPKPPKPPAPKPPKGDGSSIASSSAPSGIEDRSAHRADVGDHQPTPAGLACRAMRKHGVNANPGDPRLTTLLEQGATVEEFESIAQEAKEKGGKGFAWVLVALQNRRTEAASMALASAPAAPDWRGTRAGVVNRAAQLGLEAFDEVAAHTRTGPSWDRYRKDVIEADERQGAHA